MKYSGQRLKDEGGAMDQGLKVPGNIVFLKLGNRCVLILYYSSLNNTYLL